MPTKKFKIPITEGETSYEESLHVQISHEGGVVTEFCVAYVLTIGGKDFQPCRIDNSHGAAHMDVLNAAGDKVDVEKLPHIEAGQMVVNARDYMMTQIQFHRERLLQELGLPVE